MALVGSYVGLSKLLVAVFPVLLLAWLRFGIAALAMLQARGVAAATVSHRSARIGDCQDTWEHGVLSHVNAAAQALGLAPGQALRDAMQRLR
jgi:hypothetical protein